MAAIMFSGLVGMYLVVQNTNKKKIIPVDYFKIVMYRVN